MKKILATEAISARFSLDEKITGVWMSLLVFSQVVLPKLVPICIVFGMLHTIYGILRNQRTFHFSWITIGFGLLYLSYSVGVLFSENLALGLSYLENKLSFVLLPFIFSFRPSRLPWKWIYTSLIGSVLIAILLGLLNGFTVSGAFPELSTFAAFSGSYFSFLHHPTYFAVYILLAFFALLELRKAMSPANRISVFWGTAALLIVGYLLTISLSAYLFLILLTGYFLAKLVLHRTRKFVGWLLIMLMPVVLFLTIWSVPIMKIQLQSSMRYFSEFVKHPQQFIDAKNGKIQGDEVRLVMWTVTSEEIAEHPLGVGTGSVDIHLSQRLAQHGLHQLAKRDEKNTIAYNPHNQFLQTTLELGFIGLLVFLFIIVCALRHARKEQNLVLLVLVFSLVFNSLFESMLQRQSGIVFYTFFILLLYFLPSIEHRKKDAH